MKKTLAIMMILALTFSLITACADKPAEPIEEEHVYGKIIYVSPDGNDENSGEKDTPVASLTGAVNAMRSYREQNGLPEGGIKIEFSSGTYNVTEGITLTAEDSGTEESPIVFAGADGADVLLSGGVTLDPADFQPADDAFKSLLQTEEAKQNVVMIDLAKAGCFELIDHDNYSVTEFNNYPCPYVKIDVTYYRQELFVNGERKDVARWPNGQYCHPEVDENNFITDENGEEYVKIFITDKQAEMWRTAKNIRFYGLPDVESVNVGASHIKIANDSSALLYPVSASFPYHAASNNCLYYVYNIPQELDSSGEYYWNTETNFLYYWPETDFAISEIVFSQIKDSLFTLEDASYISFESVTAKYFRNGFVSGSGNNITVAKCELSSMAGPAAVLLTGDFITVKGCHIHELSAAGIHVQTGDIASQSQGHTVISDNIIHDFEQIYTIYNAGISILGYGALVSHNETYNTPQSGIQIRAGQCIIEYNDVHDCCTELGDGGAITTWGNFSWAGNIYRHNYVHQIKDVTSEKFGIPRYGHGNAMFFDMYGKYISCYNNLFVDVMGCMIGSSGNMTYVNNVCVNVETPITICYWGVSNDRYLYDDDEFINDIRIHDYLGQLWKYTSPRTVLLVELANQHYRENNMDLLLAPGYIIVQNNVRFIDSSSEIKPYIEPNGEEYTKDYLVRGSDYVFNMSPLLDNVCYIDEDPGFTDMTNGDYSLREDSRVFRDLIGFENIDMSVFGPRTSENPFK